MIIALLACGCGDSAGGNGGPLDAGLDARVEVQMDAAGGTPVLDAAGDDSSEAAPHDGSIADERGPDVAMRASNCFSAPGACGFPDPNYGTVGVAAGAALTASGSIVVKDPGTTVENLDVTGTITISASHTTIKNVRLNVDSKGSGVAGISIENGATDTTLQDCTIRGGAATDSPESAIFNHYAEPLTLTRVYLYNFADPLEGPATIADSFIESNGTYGSGSNIAHIEDVYVSDGTVSVDHSVLLNPSGQTATVFMDTSGATAHIAGDDHLVITNSLLAGGGWTLYPSAKSTTVGTGTMNVSNNRFARCLTSSVFDGSGTTCMGGADSHG